MSYDDGQRQWQRIDSGSGSGYTNEPTVAVAVDNNNTQYTQVNQSIINRQWLWLWQWQWLIAKNKQQKKKNLRTWTKIESGTASPRSEYVFASRPSLFL
jgi:hypothetical protein